MPMGTNASARQLSDAELHAMVDSMACLFCLSARHRSGTKPITKPQYKRLKVIIACYLLHKEHKKPIKGHRYYMQESVRRIAEIAGLKQWNVRNILDLLERWGVLKRLGEPRVYLTMNRNGGCVGIGNTPPIRTIDVEVLKTCIEGQFDEDGMDIKSFTESFFNVAKKVGRFRP